MIITQRPERTNEFSPMQRIGDSIKVKLPRPERAGEIYEENNLSFQDADGVEISLPEALPSG